MHEMWVKLEKSQTDDDQRQLISHQPSDDRAPLRSPSPSETKRNMLQVEIDKRSGRSSPQLDSPLASLEPTSSTDDQQLDASAPQPSLNSNLGEISPSQDSPQDEKDLSYTGNQNDLTPPPSPKGTERDVNVDSNSASISPSAQVPQNLEEADGSLASFSIINHQSEATQSSSVSAYAETDASAPQLLLNKNPSGISPSLKSPPDHANGFLSDADNQNDSTLLPSPKEINHQSEATQSSSVSAYAETDASAPQLLLNKNPSGISPSLESPPDHANGFPSDAGNQNDSTLLPSPKEINHQSEVTQSPVLAYVETSPMSQDEPTVSLHHEQTALLGMNDGGVYAALNHFTHSTPVPDPLLMQVELNAQAEPLNNTFDAMATQAASLLATDLPQPSEAGIEPINTEMTIDTDTEMAGGTPLSASGSIDIEMLDVSIDPLVASLSERLATLSISDDLPDIDMGDIIDPLTENRVSPQNHASDWASLDEGRLSKRGKQSGDRRKKRAILPPHSVGKSSRNVDAKHIRRRACTPLSPKLPSVGFTGSSPRATTLPQPLPPQIPSGSLVSGTIDDWTTGENRDAHLQTQADDQWQIEEQIINQYPQTDEGMVEHGDPASKTGASGLGSSGEPLPSEVEQVNGEWQTGVSNTSTCDRDVQYMNEVCQAKSSDLDVPRDIQTSAVKIWDGVNQLEQPSTVTVRDSPVQIEQPSTCHVSTQINTGNMLYVNKTCQAKSLDSQEIQTPAVKIEEQPSTNTPVRAKKPRLTKKKSPSRPQRAPRQPHSNSEEAARETLMLEIAKKYRPGKWVKRHDEPMEDRFQRSNDAKGSREKMPGCGSEYRRNLWRRIDQRGSSSLLPPVREPSRAGTQIDTETEEEKSAKLTVPQMVQTNSDGAESTTAALTADILKHETTSMVGASAQASQDPSDRDISPDPRAEKTQRPKFFKFPSRLKDLIWLLSFFVMLLILLFPIQDPQLWLPVRLPICAAIFIQYL